MYFDISVEDALKIDLENLINQVIFPIQLPDKGEIKTELKETFSYYKFMEITCNSLHLIFEELPIKPNEILRLFSRWKTLQSTPVIITFLS